MNKIKHPSYRLYIRSVKCKFDLYVDDILIEQFRPDDDESGRGLNGSVPVNSTILKNGIHNFKGRLFPWHDKNMVTNESYLELTVSIIDQDNFPNKIKLLIIKTPWQDSGEVINTPFFDLKGKFEATMLPFEIEGWTKSVNLAEEDEKKLFKETLAYYQELHAILQKRDAVKWDKLHKEKEDLIDKAFYHDYFVSVKKDPVYKAVLEERKNATAELFKEEGLELVVLNPTELKLLVQAKGRLVSLVRIDNTPALRFNDPKNEGEIEFDMRLHRKQKGSNLSII